MTIGRQLAEQAMFDLLIKAHQVDLEAVPAHGYLGRATRRHIEMLQWLRTQPSPLGNVTFGELLPRDQSLGAQVRRFVILWWKKVARDAMPLSLLNIGKIEAGQPLNATLSGYEELTNWGKICGYSSHVLESLDELAPQITSAIAPHVTSLVEGDPPQASA